LVVVVVAAEQDAGGLVGVVVEDLSVKLVELEVVEGDLDDLEGERHLEELLGSVCLEELKLETHLKHETLQRKLQLEITRFLTRELKLLQGAADGMWVHDKYQDAGLGRRTGGFKTTGGGVGGGGGAKITVNNLHFGVSDADIIVSWCFSIVAEF